MKPFLNHKIILVLIFLLALSLRLYGLNWDQGQHLHPDERFLTMVLSTIKLPNSIGQYVDTATSPLNPYNYKEYQFFVYGTFPVIITKYLATFLGLSNYDYINLVGRVLSAVFDSLNIILLYYLSNLILESTSRKGVYIPSIIYAFSVLPIQLSHFFAVDTFLTFFLLLTFTQCIYYLKKNNTSLIYLGGLSYGLALACKISAIYFLPVILAIFFVALHSSNHKFRALLRILIYFVIVFFTFRIFQPYSFTNLFTINPQFIANIKTLESFSNPNSLFPPGVQWLSKKPIFFSVQNILAWGLGIPMSSVFIFSVIILIKKITNKKLNVFTHIAHITLFLSLGWIIFLIIYQGTQFAQTMRYFLPIYPFICLVILYGLKSNPFLYKTFVYILLPTHLLYATMFLSIYSHPHSRVQASLWIYHHLPATSTLANESWDDPLPLMLPNQSINGYNGTMLPLFDPDTPEKWQMIIPQIERSEYLILSSNRLWASIPQVSQKYPDTTKYYQDLFNGKPLFGRILFNSLAVFHSYPGLALPQSKSCYYFGPTNYPGSKNNWFEIDNQCSYPGIYIRDDTAEEAFTVYDHPTVLLFNSTK